MTPLLTIQVLGLLYKYKQRQEASRVVHDEVIHFEEETDYEISRYDCQHMTLI